MSIHIKTYSELVLSLLTAIGERTRLTNFNVGSVVRTLVEITSEVVAELYAFGSDMLKQGFLDTASGIWLDRKALEYGLTRKPAVAAEGTVTFARAVPRSTNVVIPEGTIIATPRDQAGREYRFRVAAETILPSGETSVHAPVTAEASGSAWNVGAGSITVMKVFLAGIDSVTNPADWLTVAGADVETDSALRPRCLLAWDDLARGGTAQAYVAWALSVPGVASAFVDDTLPRGEGTADIYIMGDGGPPEPALIAAVQAVVDQNRPITADAQVRSPGVVGIDVVLSVIPRAGFDTAAIDTEIRRRLSVYFAEIVDASLQIIPLGVGRDVVQSRVLAIVMAVDGVYAATVIAPAGDVSIASNEVARLGGITLTMESPSYE